MTDGTAAGTSGFANDSDPIDITSIGGKAVFEGSYDGLWVTDGTAAGTSQLTVAGFSGVGGPGYTGGPDFTALSSRALFVGYDASAHPNLWVTDGTSAGTSELTVAGASSSGLFSNLYVDQEPEFTVFGAKAVFLGTDASGHRNLWVTDGTSAGTSELTVAGADSAGLFYNAIDPQFCVLGNKVLFVGRDATGHSNLWITDGTSAGTTELAVAAGQVEDGFCVVGDKVLFETADPYGKYVLWITDGTSAGTSEVAVPGAYTGGSGLTPTDITAFQPPPAPITIATNGVTSLVQIGSQYELEAVSSGSGPFLKYQGSTVTAGEFPGWTPVGAEKTATGYEVAWSLLGANEYTVWNTDNNGAYTGAATGVLSGASYALQKLESSFGEDLNGDGTIGPTVAKPPAASDFNKDSFSDILWQNTSGQAAVWELNGSNVIGSALVGGNPGPSWKEIGTGDFNGDGKSDILWQNASGQAAVWEMNGTTVSAAALIGGNPGPSWKEIGTGDFNGDGHSDILWQNASGQAAVWEMNGTNRVAGGSQPVGANPGPSWKEIGTGDFNGDGRSDILWQNANGQAAIWEMNGTNVIGSALVGGNPGPSWKAIGTGDFNGDGKSDILWQNANGQAAIWEMNGTNVIGSASVGANPGPSWELIGARDINGDGLSDLLWQNANGQAAVWEMSGTHVLGSASVGANPGPSWHAVKA